MFCHLTLNLAVTVALCHISLLIRCCVPPSVSGPPSLILLLLVPLKGCLSHMSIWSPQRVANPTPHSFFLSPLLPVTALPASTTLLFRSDGATKCTGFSLGTCQKTPATSGSVPWAVSQVSALYKSTIFTFDPKTLNLVLVVSDMNCYVSLVLQTPSLPFQFIP